MPVVKSISRGRSSAMGNPKYKVEFEDGTSAETVANGMIGYKIGQWMVGKDFEVSYNKRHQITDME